MHTVVGAADEGEAGGLESCYRICRIQFGGKKGRATRCAEAREEVACIHTHEYIKCQAEVSEPLRGPATMQYR